MLLKYYSQNYNSTEYINLSVSSSLSLENMENSNISEFRVSINLGSTLETYIFQMSIGTLYDLEQKITKNEHIIDIGEYKEQEIQGYKEKGLHLMIQV